MQEMMSHQNQGCIRLRTSQGEDALGFRMSQGEDALGFRMSQGEGVTTRVAVLLELKLRIGGTY